jgi:hypothetical protein
MYKYVMAALYRYGTKLFSALDLSAVSTEHKKTAINGLATLRRFFGNVR